MDAIKTLAVARSWQRHPTPMNF